MNSEVTFLIQKSKEGYYQAKSIEYSIFTEAKSYQKLKSLIEDSVKCHFEENNMPVRIKILLKEEIDIS